MPKTRTSGRRGFTLIELFVVIFVLAVVIALLLPALSSRRTTVLQRKWYNNTSNYSPQAADGQGLAAQAVQQETAHRPSPAGALANIKSFDATVGLTPKLSVGTIKPESIYEAKLSAKLTAAAPAKGGECEVLFPLPPHVLSLADVTVSVNGEPSESVLQRDDKLVWHGTLPAEPAHLEVTYSAVGTGDYILQTPPGGIVDTYNIQLTANESNVRMLEMSLQPTSQQSDAEKTVYTWSYKRLMFGQPIRVNVLGIAPADRLGDLGWLGPISVVVFGLVIGLMAHAYDIANFDRWMLLLVLGTFAGAYPLMYFAQDLVPLKWAVAMAAAVVLLIVAARAVSIMGPSLTFVGVIVPAAATMAITLAATIKPNLQGILLTVEAIGFFVAVMVMMPRLRIAVLPTRPTKAIVEPPPVPPAQL